MHNWSFKRHATAALRFGLAAMTIAGLFWGIFYLINGSFPTITTIGHSDHGIRLPFTYVRWMDAPLAFLTVVIYWLIHAAIVTVTVWDREEEVNAGTGLICGWIVGLIFGVICAPLIGMYPSITILLPAIIAACLVLLGWMLGVSGTLTLGTSASFANGIVASIVIGVGPGLVVGLIGVAINLAAALVIYGGKFLICDVVIEQGLMQTVWDWLTAVGVNGK